MSTGVDIPQIGVLPPPEVDVVLLNDQLAIIKDCNYRLVNSITGAQSIQKEKDSINIDAPAKGYDHLLRKICRLQYFISVESEDLVNSIERLESLEIHGHIKHKRRERRLKKKTESLAALSAAASQQCGKDDPTTQHHDTHEHHHHHHEHAHVHEEEDDSTSESDSDSSDSSSDSDEEIKFGPRKLRKFKKMILGKIEYLITYLDKMSKDLTEMKEKALVKKRTMPNIPFDISLKDSFDLQSPEIRRMLGSPLVNSIANSAAAGSHVHNNNGCANPAHLHISHTETRAISPLTDSINKTQPITPSVNLKASHDRCCSPAMNERFKSLNISSTGDIFQVDNLQDADQDDFDNKVYTNSPSTTPVQQLNQYRQKKKVSQP